MKFDWLPFLKSGKSKAQRALPPDLRLYAIGDIHGRLDLLTRIHDQIREDAGRAPETQTKRIIYLGDYIDRGLESRGVIDALLEPFPGFERVFLMGNHEEALLRFLEEPEFGRMWYGVGGDATLISYGVHLSRELRTQEERFEKARSDLDARLPAEHRAFMERLDLCYDADPYFFVHAGVRPERPLHRQTREDLLWIRDEFLLWDGAFEKIIVHGHTPTDEPEIRRNRIGIDTGAYATNTLTCLVLEGEERRFLSTRGH